MLIFLERDNPLTSGPVVHWSIGLWFVGCGVLPICLFLHLFVFCPFLYLFKLVFCFSRGFVCAHPFVHFVCFV